MKDEKSMRSDPERLEAEMAPAESVLRDVLAFLGDARNLTIEGIAAREVLVQEIEAVEQDLEAVKREHMLD
jgi:hypothetical protein